ncbi:MAG TPA: iron-sulfur cluster repair di-iron protein [Ignavibacteriaceae bacterium]|nr:iron-sulfur cluster repair di-iron protein [Ignavibacteriaceae bacterium]
MNNQTVQNGLSDALIKDIVAVNFRVASVFEKYGIDFCCKGNRPLGNACSEKGIDINALEGELSPLLDNNSVGYNENYDQWELDFLASYIVNTHHRYVANSIPEIYAHLNKLVNVHGGRHPELAQLRSLFGDIANELTSHMQKEEKILFPAIAKLVQMKKNNEKVNGFSVSRPIEVMEYEHQGAGNILEQIRTISNNFTLPEDACGTYAVTYKELEAFELDLHKHIFLENGILFPKAIQLEKDLM